MRLQSSHSSRDREADAYFTPDEATFSLLHIEHNHIPNCLWEPAAGNGAMCKLLAAAGYTVYASDLIDYGFPLCNSGIDYLTSTPIAGIQGIITNPPFRLALQFAEKAVSEVPYVALLLRTNFLESTARLPFFLSSPPARIWISSRRLPMMHRLGWTGPQAPSNTCYAWFVWDALSKQKAVIDWFDWKKIVSYGVSPCLPRPVDLLALDIA